MAVARSMPWEKPGWLARVGGWVFGTLCRAMAWDQILADQSPHVRADYGRNAVVWLDIFREGVERGVRLGAS